MVHSVELTLDADADSAVRGIWQALADNGVPSQAAHRSPTNRPHVTLTVASGLSAQADTELAGLLHRLPFPCRIGAPVVFGRGPFTVALLMVPSSELLDLHAQVNRICLPHMVAGPLSHSMVGQWTPHVTVARRIDAGLLGPALTVAGQGPDIVGAVAGLRHWDGDARREHPIGPDLPG